MSGAQGLKLTFNKITNKCVGKVQTMQSPIIIMHGLFGNSNNNRSMANCILEIETNINPLFYRNIYLLNMRNHGTSPCSNEMSYDIMSQDIFRFINDHELFKPVLIGHSMGGKIAMKTVLKEPEISSGLVVIENSPVKQPINVKFIEYIDFLQEICQDPGIKTLSQARENLQKVEINPLISGFLLTLLQKNKINDINQPGFVSKVPLNILRRALEDGSISEWKDENNHCQYSGPSLFIKGSNSHYLQEDQDLTKIKQCFPGSTIETIAGAGHFVNAEQPRKCASLITRFLSCH